MADIFGRYYTTDVFSNLLVNQLDFEKPSKIIDLGVGGGSLLKAAINKWQLATFYATDIDKRSINKIQKELPFVNSFHIDTLKYDIFQKVNLNKGELDLAICNPPFLKIKRDANFIKLFNEARLSDCNRLGKLTSDIIFLAKNIQLLKENGELGIILPDSLITGKDFELLRKALLEQHNIKCIIELPEKIYPKTEALTHILIIEKSKISSNQKFIYRADKNGRIIDNLQVDSSRLLERMDFKYHDWHLKKKRKKKSLTLANIKADIRRGTLSHVDLKIKKDVFIHSTNLIDKKENLAISNSILNFENYPITQKGDILMTRVGRTRGKISKIAKGKALFSDCVYRIRVEKKYIDRVWDALISKDGQKWLEANSHGVCAKVISKKDLLNFPI